MKKGFTLIELAIALMVIGLILAMAMKGRSVVESAELKSDINKIKKVSTAITTYYSKHEVLPGKEASGSIAYTNTKMLDDLFEESSVTLDDFYLSTENAYINVVGCNKPWWGEDGGYRIIANNFNGEAGTGGMCMVISTVSPDKVEGTADIKYKTTNSLACHIEKMLDDESFVTGHGLWGESMGASGMDLPEDCYDEPLNVGNYAYAIF